MVSTLNTSVTTGLAATATPGATRPPGVAVVPTWNGRASARTDALRTISRPRVSTQTPHRPELLTTGLGCLVSIADRHMLQGRTDSAGRTTEARSEPFCAFGAQAA